MPVSDNGPMLKYGFVSVYTSTEWGDAEGVIATHSTIWPESRSYCENRIKPNFQMQLDCEIPSTVWADFMTVQPINIDLPS